VRLGPPSTRARTLALDVEGTLLDLPVEIEGVRRRVRAAFAARGVSIAGRPLLAQIRSGAEAIALREGPAAGEESLREAYTIIERAELDGAPRARARPGAARLLELAASRGDRVVLVSNTAESAVRVGLAISGLAAFRLEAIVGREAGRDPKPSTAPLLAALDGLPRPLGELVVVGDGVHDITMARAAATLLSTEGAEVQAVGLAATEEAARALREAGADLTVPDLDGFIARIYVA
jgi:phosphoglycolate phosphatase-like HAD superfamily hydrolase